MRKKSYYSEKPMDVGSLVKKVNLPAALKRYPEMIELYGEVTGKTAGIPGLFFDGPKFDAVPEGYGPQLEKPFTFQNRSGKDLVITEVKVITTFSLVGDIRPFTFVLPGEMTTFGLCITTDIAVARGTTFFGVALRPEVGNPFGVYSTSVVLTGQAGDGTAFSMGASSTFTVEKAGLHTAATALVGLTRASVADQPSEAGNFFGFSPPRYPSRTAGYPPLEQKPFSFANDTNQHLQISRVSVRSGAGIIGPAGPFGYTMPLEMTSPTVLLEGGFSLPPGRSDKGLVVVPSQGCHAGTHTLYVGLSTANNDAADTAAQKVIFNVKPGKGKKQVSSLKKSESAPADSAGFFMLPPYYAPSVQGYTAQPTGAFTLYNRSGQDAVVQGIKLLSLSLSGDIPNIMSGIAPDKMLSALQNVAPSKMHIAIKNKTKKTLVKIRPMTGCAPGAHVALVLIYGVTSDGAPFQVLSKTVLYVQKNERRAQRKDDPVSPSRYRPAIIITAVIVILLLLLALLLRPTVTLPPDDTGPDPPPIVTQEQKPSGPVTSDTLFVLYGYSVSLPLPSGATGGQWVSADSAIATADSSGKVQGQKVGNTMLTFDDPQTGSRTSVPVVVYSMWFSSGELALSPGESARIQVHFSQNLLDAGGDTTGRWLTGDSGVATVTGGLVTATGVGMTNIRFIHTLSGGILTASLTVDLPTTAALAPGIDIGYHYTFPSYVAQEISFGVWGSPAPVLTLTPASPFMLVDNTIKIPAGLPANTYYVVLEAVNEHGTYTVNIVIELTP